MFGVSLGAGVADGVGREVVRFFFFGFGVGVDRTKSFFSLSPRVSSCSSVARMSATLIASAVAITKTRRSIFFTRNSGRQLLQHRFVHLDAGLEIFQREIFIRRMRATIRQR